MSNRPPAFGVSGKPKVSKRSSPASNPATSSATSPRARRPLLYTLTFAAVTIMGAYYGAGLKMQQEHAQMVEKQLELPINERIEGLLARRSELVKMKNEVNEKLKRLDAKKADG